MLGGDVVLGIGSAAENEVKSVRWRLVKVRTMWRDDSRGLRMTDSCRGRVSEGRNQCEFGGRRGRCFWPRQAALDGQVQCARCGHRVASSQDVSQGVIEEIGRPATTSVADMTAGFKVSLRRGSPQQGQRVMSIPKTVRSHSAADWGRSSGVGGVRTPSSSRQRARCWRLTRLANRP